MSSANRYIPHYTVDDYHRWSGDWELWQGLPVAMTPSPFGRHARVLAAATTALKNAVDAVGCAATVLAEIDWIVSDDTVVRPDIVVVCGDEPQRHVEQPPAIVVEVLSEGTRDRDLDHKKSLYQDQQVAYYLVLDPDSDTLLAMEFGDGDYRELEHHEGAVKLVICGDCRLEIAVERLFR